MNIRSWVSIPPHTPAPSWFIRAKIRHSWRMGQGSPAFSYPANPSPPLQTSIATSSSSKKGSAPYLGEGNLRHFASASGFPPASQFGASTREKRTIQSSRRVWKV